MSRRRRRGRHRKDRTLPLGTVFIMAAAAAGVYMTMNPGGASAATTDVYVATSGSDSNPGTLAAPYRTLAKAISLVAPGTVIYVRGGTYYPTATLKSTVSGTSSQRVTLTAYGSEKVKVDGSGLPSGSWLMGLYANYWTVSGIQFQNSPAQGFVCTSCTGGIFRNLTTNGNGDSGFTLRGDNTVGNLVENLDSYSNYDPAGHGQNADGVAVKFGSGTGNVITGARLYNNSDDGIDLWSWASPVTIEHTWSFGNGKNRWNDPVFQGNGNGFELGGGSPVPAAAHVVDNSAAWDNASNGFTENGNTGAIQLNRTTAYANKASGYIFAASAARLGKNLAVSNSGASVARSGSVVSSGNNWDSGVPTPSFVSTDATTAYGARASDGSLPATTFLTTGSTTIGATMN
jgi:hypothetical protein